MSDEPTLRLEIDEPAVVVFPSLSTGGTHAGRIVQTSIMSVTSEKVVTADGTVFDRDALPGDFKPDEPGGRAFAYLFHPKSRWVARTVRANAAAVERRETLELINSAIDGIHGDDFAGAKADLMAAAERL